MILIFLDEEDEKKNDKENNDGIYNYEEESQEKQEQDNLANLNVYKDSPTTRRRRVPNPQHIKLMVYYKRKTTLPSFQSISSIRFLYKISYINNKFQMQSEGTSYNPYPSNLHTQRPSFYSPPPEARALQSQVGTASSMTNIHYSEFDRMGSSHNSPSRANRSGQLRSSSGCCNNGSSYTSRCVDYQLSTPLLILTIPCKYRVKICNIKILLYFMFGIVVSRVIPMALLSPTRYWKELELEPKLEILD